MLLTALPASSSGGLEVAYRHGHFFASGYDLGANPSYARLIKLYRHGSCHLTSGRIDQAIVSWPTLGIKAYLITYGTLPSGETICSDPADGPIDRVVFTASNFSSDRGIGPGNSSVTLRASYPQARYHAARAGYPSGWWITTRVPYGTHNQAIPLIIARTASATAPVSALVMLVRAQGE